ncbi:HD-GYP domain-containing protein [Clostridium sp. LIBA-8841]|uniref:HD-GYP domain-containing protein n=1 Tax=Clostridium sp. LIBA-8841 TaxID=2987530 RepID=UPI002AC54236|nr:HD domain-containing phosphohydrolase [Clostridium sp. LIBA-8841]MDZ5253506.1 HD domain-containing protein [Clostridium sp. LIBA-8841]
MKFDLTKILFALSFALDCVERDLLGVKTNHSKRVAYICVEICKEIGLTNENLFDISACAILHDNALTEYIYFEYKEYSRIYNKYNFSPNEHCILGEKNVMSIPFYNNIAGSILYHHENANGSGPFGKKSNEVPLYARLIHLADTLDTKFDLTFVSFEKFKEIKYYLSINKDILFDSQVIEWFLNTFTFDKLLNLRNEHINNSLSKSLPKINFNYSSNDLINFSKIFAKIIDYKSEFTQKHSLGLANKAVKVGEYYGLSVDTKAKMYFAGAVHDIGKLAVDVDVLEKPGKLTSEEYKHIQTHVYYTYTILKDIEGLEDVASWAYCHHEKLDGSGYPFGKTASELGKFERLFACLDIYQALTEKRPYKDGMSHNKAILILKHMASSNLLDDEILDDIDKVFA